jgi:glycosyltransferase involved in cell wall biosynthesis
VPAGDAVALADALEDMVSAPEALRRMGEEGRRRARSYDWDVVLPQILDVYREAVEHRRAAHRS